MCLENNSSLFKYLKNAYILMVSRQKRATKQRAT
jgi:hypothetical protein